MISQAMVATKPGSPRRARNKPLKPFARGMPDENGVIRCDLLVCFFSFAREAAGRVDRPAFPAPLILRGQVSLKPTCGARAARSHQRGCDGLAVIPGWSEGPDPESRSPNGEHLARQLPGNEFCLRSANHKPCVWRACVDWVACDVAFESSTLFRSTDCR